MPANKCDKNSKLGPFDVRVGDIWTYLTNNGVITREVTVIGNKRMAYIGANGKERVCLISTFKRWWRGAEIEFATDWDGREA